MRTVRLTHLIEQLKTHKIPKEIASIIPVYTNYKIENGFFSKRITYSGCIFYQSELPFKDHLKLKGVTHDCLLKISKKDMYKIDILNKISVKD